jgi:phosphopantetheinyl transferase
MEMDGRPNASYATWERLKWSDLEDRESVTQTRRLTVLSPLSKTPFFFHLWSVWEAFLRNVAQGSTQILFTFMCI